MSNFDDFYLSKAAGKYSLYKVGEENEAYKEPLRINSVAALIFEKLKEGLTEEEIGAYIADKYEININESLKDVKTFVNQLKDFGVLVNIE